MPRQVIVTLPLSSSVIANLDGVSNSASQIAVLEVIEVYESILLQTTYFVCNVNGPVETVDVPLAKARKMMI
jgi:hypothetical protein